MNTLNNNKIPVLQSDFHSFDDVASVLSYQLPSKIYSTATSSANITTLQNQSTSLEFFPLSKQAEIHDTTTPRYDLATAFDNFGLCTGCFHNKKPHHHYLAPVRIGGGYSIYHRHQVLWQVLSKDEAARKTLHWLSDLEIYPKNTNVSNDSNDSYSRSLFEQYVNNGGDPAALKEYLDSNFNEGVLEELRNSGVNIDLVVEYSELYRNHIKSLLQANIQKQSNLIKKCKENLDYAAMFVKIKRNGVDMKILSSFLKHGEAANDAILKYEKNGGNVKLLKHFAQQICDNEYETQIKEELENYVAREELNQKNKLFLNFLKSGGDVHIMQEYASAMDGSVEINTMNATQEKFLEICATHFNDEETFQLHVKHFIQSQLPVYESVELLQEFIENDGNIKKLKDFVALDCDSHVLEDMEGDEKTKKLLKKIGQKFSQKSELKKILKEFPDEPDVIESYIKTGGDVQCLVKAISYATDTPNLPTYLNQLEFELVFMTNKFKSKSNVSNMLGDSFTSEISSYLFPKFLKKAKADLVFDELMATKHYLYENEGPCLAKAIETSGIFPMSHESNWSGSFVTQVHCKPVVSDTHPLFSTITGRARKTLWVAPKPFEIRHSRPVFPQPRTPFTRQRYFHIPSLTENHIMDTNKRQRQELKILRKKWNLLSGRSREPISIPIEKREERSQNSQQFLRISNIARKGGTEGTSKIVKRKQLREKMKALKKANNESRNASPAEHFQETSEHDDDSHKIIRQYAIKSQEILLDNQLHTMESDEANVKQMNDCNIKTQSEATHKVFSPIFQENGNNFPIGVGEESMTYMKPDRHKALVPVTSQPSYDVLPPIAIQEKKGEPAFRLQSSNSNHDLSESTFCNRREERKDEQIAEDVNDASFLDILKNYYIIREERVAKYKQLFNKYVLVKQLRNREKVLAIKRSEKHDTNHQGGNVVLEENSTRADLAKTNLALEKLRETIKETQLKIGVAKRMVNEAMIQVATNKSLDHFTSTSLTANTDSVQTIPEEIRHQCTSHPIVRDRKVVLVNLRDKIKKLFLKEKKLLELRCSYLQKIDREDAEKGINRRNTKHFMKQNRSYQAYARNESDDRTIDMCDLIIALKELDPVVASFDDLQLIEEIPNLEGVSFHTFSVIAALHEKSIDYPNTNSLDHKMRVCKEHYNRMLGTSIDVLSTDLAAARFSKIQRKYIIEKLSRDGYGSFKFMDFVSYIPFFLDIHAKILDDPLS